MKSIDYLARQKWRLLDFHDKRNGIQFCTTSVPTRFGFFGELGYGLLSFLPYLNYLVNMQNRYVETFGPVGSAPFFYFSKRHTELDIVSVPGWGNREVGKRLMAYAEDQPIFVPRAIKPCGVFAEKELSWEIGDLGSFSGQWNYLNLELDPPVELSIQAKQLLQSEFCILNLKRYFNWGNREIPNFYSVDEILKLADFCLDHQMLLLVNDHNPGIQASEIPIDSTPFAKLAEMRENIVLLSEILSENQELEIRTAIQLFFLGRAQRVFATQGGNGILSIICNRNVTLLMRGGFDWPDCVSTARRYGTNLEVLYEINQSKIFQNHL